MTLLGMVDLSKASDSYETMAKVFYEPMKAELLLLFSKKLYSLDLYLDGTFIGTVATYDPNRNESLYSPTAYRTNRMTPAEVACVKEKASSTLLSGAQVSLVFLIDEGDSVIGVATTLAPVDPRRIEAAEDEDEDEWTRELGETVTSPSIETLDADRLGALSSTFVFPRPRAKATAKATPTAAASSSASSSALSSSTGEAWSLQANIIRAILNGDLKWLRALLGMQAGKCTVGCAVCFIKALQIKNKDYRNINPKPAMKTTLTMREWAEKYRAACREYDEYDEPEHARNYAVDTLADGEQAQSRRRPRKPKAADYMNQVHEPLVDCDMNDVGPPVLHMRIKMPDEFYNKHLNIFVRTKIDQLSPAHLDNLGLIDQLSEAIGAGEKVVEHVNAEVAEFESEKEELKKAIEKGFNPDPARHVLMQQARMEQHLRGLSASVSQMEEPEKSVQAERYKLLEKQIADFKGLDLEIARYRAEKNIVEANVKRNGDVLEAAQAQGTTGKGEEKLEVKMALPISEGGASTSRNAYHAHSFNGNAEKNLRKKVPNPDAEEEEVAEITAFVLLIKYVPELARDAGVTLSEEDMQELKTLRELWEMWAELCELMSIENMTDDDCRKIQKLAAEFVERYRKAFGVGASEKFHWIEAHLATWCWAFRNLTLYIEEAMESIHNVFNGYEVTYCRLRNKAHRYRLIARMHSVATSQKSKAIMAAIEDLIPRRPKYNMTKGKERAAAAAAAAAEAAAATDEIGADFEVEDEGEAEEGGVAAEAAAAVVAEMAAAAAEIATEDGAATAREE